MSERQPGDVARLILDRYRALHPAQSQAVTVRARVDISRIDKYAPEELVGREDETGADPR